MVTALGTRTRIKQYVEERLQKGHCSASGGLAKVVARTLAELVPLECAHPVSGTLYRLREGQSHRFVIVVLCGEDDWRETLDENLESLLNAGTEAERIVTVREVV